MIRTFALSGFQVTELCVCSAIHMFSTGSYYDSNQEMGNTEMREARSNFRTVVGKGVTGSGLQTYFD